MKKLILATLLCGMFSSCTENMSGHRTTEERGKLPYYTDEFTWENHNYISNPRGGIIHSESCKCKGGNK
jgi:hypothetical protein